VTTRGQFAVTAPCTPQQTCLGRRAGFGIHFSFQRSTKRDKQTEITLRDPDRKIEARTCLMAILKAWQSAGRSLLENFRFLSRRGRRREKEGMIERERERERERGGEREKEKNLCASFRACDASELGHRNAPTAGKRSRFMYR